MVIRDPALQFRAREDPSAFKLIERLNLNQT